MPRHKSSQPLTFDALFKNMDEAQQCFISGMVVIEDLLHKLIMGVLHVPSALNLDELGFGTKVSLAVALGVLDPSSKKAYIVCYDARSRYAHSIHDALTVDEVLKLSKQFRPEQIEWPHDANPITDLEHFDALLAVQALIVGLYNELISALATHAPSMYDEYLELLHAKKPNEE